MKSLYLDNYEDIGMYIHIPYCSFLCHYCDFAKTANWDDQVVNTYFHALESQIKVWLSYLDQKDSFRGFSSMFFGGGTPGLFTDRLAEVVALVRPYFLADAEVSLEANPNNISDQSLKVWSDAGFNRLSIGIQTFEQEGLKFLKRDHDPVQALDAVLRAHTYFERVNVDLIYGWQGQDLSSWRRDLMQVLDMGVTHLSLYNLIYESKTPIGRAMERHKIEPQEEKLQTSYYTLACELLKKEGFLHDEVSNWAKPGSSCRHNWLYWTNRPYIGVGAGAHGYLPEGDIGLRYFYPRNDRTFNQMTKTKDLKQLSDYLGQQGLETEDDRDTLSWLLEYVGCGLRCRQGVNLDWIQEKTGRTLKPNKLVQMGMTEGKIIVDKGVLYLIPVEWIRETAWSLEVIESLQI